ncbi:MAG: hypothetical protein LBM77_11315 [Spirochaetaceae bacterium]|jgi:hypothetical protein|nr:hypothetical protein [Spirochaetaceae bacterium]
MMNIAEQPARKDNGSSDRIEILRKKINNSVYLNNAIWRLATSMSDELLGIPHGGTIYEQRKIRK